MCTVRSCRKYSFASKKYTKKRSKMRPGISCLNNVQFVFFAPKIMPKKQNTQYDLRVFERRHCKLFRNNRASAYYSKTNPYESILSPMSFSRKKKADALHFRESRAKKKTARGTWVAKHRVVAGKGSLPLARFLSLFRKKERIRNNRFKVSKGATFTQTKVAPRKWSRLCISSRSRPFRK